MGGGGSGGGGGKAKLCDAVLVQYMYCICGRRGGMGQCIFSIQKQHTVNKGTRV